MYVSTNTGGEPFYGYAANGVPLGYHYIDGNSGDWNLIAANKLRLAVEGNGGTRFYNSASQPSVEITNEQGRSLFRRWNPEGTLGDVGMSFDVFENDTYLRVPGRVAVNTVDPAAQMEIEAGSKTAMILNRTGSDGVVMQIDNDGVAAGSISVSGSTVSYNAFSGSHYARVADAAKVPGRGLLLTMTGDNVRMNGLEDGETVHGVEVSSMANDPAVIGVSNGLLEQNPLLAAAEGNGDLWVVDDGRGDIKPGDLLISSDTPGHAMLDDAARFETGYIVARAAGRVRWETVAASADGKRRVKLAVLFDRSTRSGRAPMGSTTARASRSER